MPDDAPPRASRVQLSRWSAWQLLVIVAAAMLCLATTYFWATSSSERSYALTLSAGSRSGQRQIIAETLSTFARQRGIQLTVKPSLGSLDALRRVNEGELDLALVQGGLVFPNYDRVREVAVLHVEPLHLLVKPGPHVDGHITVAEVSRQLSELSKPVINLSDPNSGTHALAVELLRFFGLSAGDNYVPSEMSYAELMADGLELEQLPDAVFTVSSLPSPLAKHLIGVHGYRPVELPVASAFRIDWSSDLDVAQSGKGVSRRRTFEADIPAFTYQVNPPVPDVSLDTLGTRLHLVANQSVPADAVERIADAIYNSSFASMSQPPLAVGLLQSSNQFELHVGAAAYLLKKTPIITEHAIELTEQVVAILGAVFGGGVFAWQFVVFVRRRRKDRQFFQYIEQVSEIERQALSFEQDDAKTLQDLIRLQVELNRIKQDIIGQFQKGEIEGADTLSGFLLHVNGANENLTRMILHERQPRIILPS